MGTLYSPLLCLTTTSERKRFKRCISRRNKSLFWTEKKNVTQTDVRGCWTGVGRSLIGFLLDHIVKST